MWEPGGRGAGSRRALDASPGVGASQEKHAVTSQAFKRVTWSAHAAWWRPEACGMDGEEGRAVLLAAASLLLPRRPACPCWRPCPGPPCGALFPDPRGAGAAPGPCQSLGALRSCSRRCRRWPRAGPTPAQLVLSVLGTVRSRACGCSALRRCMWVQGDVGVPLSVPELSTTRPGRDIAGRSAAGAELPGLACRVVAELPPLLSVCALLRSVSPPSTCHLCP